MGCDLGCKVGSVGVPSEEDYEWRGYVQWHPALRRWLVASNWQRYRVGLYKGQCMPSLW
jgi:hypothetical protein